MREEFRGRRFHEPRLFIAPNIARDRASYYPRPALFAAGSNKTQVFTTRYIRSFCNRLTHQASKSRKSRAMYPLKIGRTANCRKLYAR